MDDYAYPVAYIENSCSAYRIKSAIHARAKYDKNCTNRIQQMEPNNHEEAVSAITKIVGIATPKTSTRGKKDRDRLVRRTIAALKGMMYDKRVKKCN